MSFREIYIERSRILNDIIIFKPSVNIDLRGTIFTTYNRELYDKYLPGNISFIHDKFAESKKNVIRGLHGDVKTWKLITCVYGEIFQVVVDMRDNSPTYLKWDSWIINDINKIQVLVPPNFVNGYLVLSEKAIFHYKLAYEGDYFDINNQVVVKWNDSRLGIEWPVKNPILQGRDK